MSVFHLFHAHFIHQMHKAPSQKPESFSETSFRYVTTYHKLLFCKGLKQSQVMMITPKDFSISATELYALG